jgi:RNA polymerase sigma-70 factor (ECF subfamily)
MVDMSLKTNQTAEFVRLYAEHNRRIYGLLRALIPNPADVDEAFQNTCEVLWSKFDRYQHGSDFFAWASTIARFEALRLLRGKGRDSRVFSDDFVDRVADQALETAGEIDLQHRALAECFQSLAPKYQAMIQARYSKEGSTQQIAERFSMSTNAVYKVLRRVHEMLFECIQKRMPDEGMGGSRGTA